VEPHIFSLLSSTFLKKVTKKPNLTKVKFGLFLT